MTVPTRLRPILPPRRPLAFAAAVATGLGMLTVGLMAGDGPPGSPRAAPAVVAPAFDPHPARPIEVLGIHDGDTFRARLACEAGVSIDLDIRLHNFDAPEIADNAHGTADPVNGPKAREALVKILSDDGAAGRVWVKLTGDRTFARWVADAWIVAPDGGAHDVAAMMRAQGWDVGPGREPPHSKD